MKKTNPFSEEYERELILKAQKLDQKAFNELMGGHYNFCWNVVKRYCDYDSDIEEVVQEVLMKVWLKLNTFQFNSRFSTWLFRVSANHAIKNLTSRHRIASHPHNQVVSYESGILRDEEDDLGYNYTRDDLTFGINYESPEDLLEAERLGELIFEQTEMLTDDLKESLYMREIMLMSYEEMAEALDVPVGTVKSRLFNARSKLDEKLKRKLGLEETEARFTI